MSNVSKEVELQRRKRMLCDNEQVCFTQSTREYGVAWFNMCALWRTVKRSKSKRVTALYIYPRAQPDAQEFYAVEGVACEAFSVDSWTHRGITSPRVWNHVWCPEHQCVSVCVYVPAEANCFKVSILPSALSVYFDNNQVSQCVGEI